MENETKLKNDNRTLAEKMDDDVRTYSLNELSYMLNVTQRQLRQFIKLKQINAIKVGKFFRVSHNEVVRIIRCGTGTYK